jgi:DNA modification methylase
MKNKIYYGDNLDVLRKYIKDETVDLCYIDPPFNSKRNYNQIYNNVGKEDKAQAQAFVDTWTWDDYANQALAEIQANYHGALPAQTVDLIEGLTKVLQKSSLLAYLVNMTLRIAEIHRVLKPTGSFYLHCDPNSSHYLKLVLDAIFCAQGGDFQNEIVWSYKTGGASKKRFSKKHDVILFYTKSNHYLFNPQKEKSYMMHKYGFKKSDFQIDEASGLQYSMVYQKDVFDIPTIGSDSSERLGYPTQKPEALLERIIKSSSNEGDIILDAYCGCGTTVAVAEKLKRQWIGIDITYQSISLILRRLGDQNADIDNIEMNGVPKDFDSAVALANKTDDRVRKEFEKWAVLTHSKNRAMIHEKKGGDGGIDGIAYVTDKVQGKVENRKVLFSVKSNKTLSPAVIRELNGTIERENAACGVLLTLYPMPNLVKESKQYGLYHNNFNDNDYPKIQVVSVGEIFDGQRLELPNVMKVLKDAEQHVEQTNFF